MNHDVATKRWGEQVAQRLLDSMTCPVCEHGELAGGCCTRCGADLRGHVGMRLWHASTAAAAAMRAREALIVQVPQTGAGVAGQRTQDAPSAQVVPRARTAQAAPGDPVAPSQVWAPSLPPTAPPSGSAPVPPSTPRSSATLQSVLATAGAALFAIAAIVFTYFNPDLADRGLRAVVIGVVTVLFLGGGWLLARRGLRFSAEAVGGLGLVFAGLDVHAAAQLEAPAIEPWLTAAIGTAAVAGVMLAASLVSGIRIWLWTGLIALAAVPAMLGYATGPGVGATLGHLGVAFAGAALTEALPRLARGFHRGAEAAEGMPAPTDLRPERIALVVVQLLASLSAIALLVTVDAPSPAVFTFVLAATLALVSVHAVIAARHLLARLWSLGAGAAGVAAVTAGVYAALWPFVDEQGWAQAVIPAAAAGGLILVAGILPLPARVPRRFVAGGALAAVGAASAVPLSYAGMVGAFTAAEFLRFTSSAVTATDGSWPWALVLGLAALGAGLGVFGPVARRRTEMRGLATVTDAAAAAFAMIAVLLLGCHRLLTVPASVVVLAGTATAIAAVLLLLGRRVRPSLRVVLLIGAHLMVVASVMVTWRDPSSAPGTGAATLIALAAAGAAGAAGARFLHVGAGFGYALILIASALGLWGVDGVAQLSLTASAGLAVAIVVTFLPRIGARAWRTVLVVAVVPFGLGVLQVIVERSGWTALSTALMLALAMSLLLTRRPGLTVVVRTLAAGMLVPALAVVIVCLGAQLLAGSASPVTLPIIAAVVALVLPSTTLIRDALVRHGLDGRSAGAARIAIEASALLTGAIATGLAFVRDAAGLGTTFLVLLILGVGALAGALSTRRRYAWWVAGAAFTGALWCVWGLTGVELAEAYLLPPALAASAVAAVLTLRGRRATGLYAAGLGVAILPLLVLLAVEAPGLDGADPAPWRTAGLLAASCVLLGIGTLLGAGFEVRSPRLRRLRRLRALRTATLGAAGLAALSGAVQGVRLGLGRDLPWLEGAGLFVACLGVSAVGALVLACAGRGIRAAASASSRLRRSRWLEAPAVLALAVGVWPAIERDWFSIWAMWMLMLALLATMVLAARRGPHSTLPPVWFLFAVSFVTAIVAWSPRDLRVEWFSLPLGVFLLLAGVRGSQSGSPTLSKRPDAAQRPTLNSWPGRWSGSWALLAPGIVTMMIASIVSTFTDPLTWRAILVMVLALAAILIGSARRLAAPFLLGLIVLPIENVFVFSVQIGRGVESMPWWITLAVMGAVLLIIAVTAERRTGSGASVAARIRDLR